MLGYLPIDRDSDSAPVEWLLYAAVLAVPAWAFLQTIPLPFALVALLSPERAAMTHALLRFEPNPGAVPLSIRPEATLQYALRYLAFGATFLITRDLMWRMPGRQWLIAVPPVLIASLQAVVGLLQNTSGLATVAVSGTFVNRSHFSAMLEMCLPFAVGAVFCYAPHARRALAACVGAVCATLLLVAVALSLSRAGFAIALLSLILLSWLHAIARLRGTGRMIVVAGIPVVAAVCGISLASGRLLDRMAFQLTAGHFPFDKRLLFWRETLRVITAYPLTGCGFGGFVSAVTPWRTAGVTRTLDYAHNDYLQFTAEGGVIGFVLAGIVGYLLVRVLWRNVFSSTNFRDNGLAFACATALFAGMIHSSVDLITYVPATGMLLCWIAGMVAGLDSNVALRQNIGQHPWT